MENIGTILGVAALIIPLWIVMWLIGRVLVGANDRSTRAEEFDSRFQTEQMRRNTDLVALGWKMKSATGNPEEVNRIYREEYAPLKAAYDKWTAEQVQTLIELQGCIDDQTQAELDAGINPYVVEKSVKKSKRARLGWQE